MNKHFVHGCQVFIYSAVKDFGFGPPYQKSSKSTINVVCGIVVRVICQPSVRLTAFL